jgi:hypothetical protein
MFGKQDPIIDSTTDESSMYVFSVRLKETVSRNFLLLVFFINQFPPQPQSIPLRLFQIFSKIRGDIRKSRCTTGINDTGGKFFHQFR